MPFHAIDIALTRPCTPAELDRAAKTSSLPLAADAESRHLMAVVRAKTPTKALHPAPGTCSETRCPST